jgi:thiol-disulfide isomerase/thioredoxin
MIRFRNLILFSSAVVALLLLTDPAAQAGSGVKVKPIDDATLGKLITDGDNRLLLSFMAAWCGPCIEELPHLNKLHKKYKRLGFQVIGISIDYDGPGAMQPVVNKLKIDFPVYWCGEKAVDKFKLKAIPMLIFIKQGEIVERLHGKRPEKFLDDKVREFLK